jgi:Ca2+-binding RTX toxin-like protein
MAVPLQDGRSSNVINAQFSASVQVDPSDSTKLLLSGTSTNTEIVTALPSNSSYGFVEVWQSYQFNMTRASAISPFETFTPNNAVVIAGSSGNDTISASSDGTNLLATLNGVAANPLPLGAVSAVDIAAGAGNDLVTIESSLPASMPVSIAGGAGDDTILGGPGNDTLGGGPGNDSISGGPGDDVIRGGLGNDTLGGGQGNDQVFGGAGANLLRGGQGNDTLTGGAGPDTMFGGPGNDVFEALSASSDSIDGGLATNTAHVAAGNADILSNIQDTIVGS